MKYSTIAACLAACMAWTSADALDMRTASALPLHLQAIQERGRTQPAPASALLSDRHLRVNLTLADWRGDTLTLLVLPDPSKGDRLLAAVARAQSAAPGAASYRWYPATGKACQASETDLAGLEHLYRFAINDVVTDTFRFSAGESNPEEADRELTHAQLLSRIARERGCIAATLIESRAAPLQRWRSVSLEAAGPAQDRSSVSARLRDAGRPMARATILFTRSPHLECSGTTDSTGLATCRLEDTHPHGGQDENGDHEDDDSSASPTLASYPGEVGAGLILLPTTLVDRTQ